MLFTLCSSLVGYPFTLTHKKTKAHFGHVTRTYVFNKLIVQQLSRVSPDEGRRAETRWRILTLSAMPQ